MIISNFNDDLIGFRDFSDRLLRFIEVEHHFVDGSLVIGLSSKYGSGKTTFFRMLKDDLEKGNSVIGPVTVVSLNAWESDYYGDPLFSIVSALVGCIQESGKEADPIISAAKDLGWFATAIGSQVVSKFTGINPVAAGEVAEKKKAARAAQPPVPVDAFTVYQVRKKAMGQLQAALGKFVTESDAKVLFLVDELDRCRPDYAISYLETIKHIFDLPGATFILAADRHHLENSAKTAFGPDLDFDEYYRKFVHREVTLPIMSEEVYARFASAYAKHFLERDDIRLCFMPLDGYRMKNVTELIAALKLTPRQIQECFRVLGHMLSTTEDRRGRLLWCISVSSIAMSALRIGRPDIFHKLGARSLTPTEALQLLKADLRLKHCDWWFTLFATGQGIVLSEGKNILDAMKEANLVAQDAEPSSLNFAQWHQGWGHSFDNRFTQAHERIEQIMQW
jgi:hypothetical protein